MGAKVQQVIARCGCYEGRICAEGNRLYNVMHYAFNAVVVEGREPFEDVTYMTARTAYFAHRDAVREF